MRRPPSAQTRALRALTAAALGAILAVLGAVEDPKPRTVVTTNPDTHQPDPVPEAQGDMISVDDGWRRQQRRREDEVRQMQARGALESEHLRLMQQLADSARKQQDGQLGLAEAPDVDATTAMLATIIRRSRGAGDTNARALLAQWLADDLAAFAATLPRASAQPLDPGAAAYPLQQPGPGGSTGLPPQGPGPERFPTQGR